MNVLLLTSHSIAEYDDLRMLTDLGYDVFSIGAYTDPHFPTDDKRPPVWPAVGYNDFADLCDERRAEMASLYGEPGPNIDWAKARLHPDIVDWADAIIVHHFPDRWIGGQWDAIRHKRVIWRTCGQSDPNLEAKMTPFRAEGLEIVRYSPNERKAFEPVCFAGEDAVIRFGKYPSDYGPWVGDIAAVGNVTQNMAQRGEACGYDRWQRVTEGLPTQPAGPGSWALSAGLGPLSYEAMVEYLRHIRAYLYLGTMPASYTLGLIEAMMSGVPVVPVSWSLPLDHQWLNRLWEADTLVPLEAKASPDNARPFLQVLLENRDYAAFRGEEHRQAALALFDVAVVGPQWKAFLG